MNLITSVSPDNKLKKCLGLYDEKGWHQSMVEKGESFSLIGHAMTTYHCFRYCITASNYRKLIKELNKFFGGWSI